MEMRKGEEKRAVYLPPRSLLIMAESARYEWLHYIPHRKADMVQGVNIPRSRRRVSFTFRKVRHLTLCKTSPSKHCKLCFSLWTSESYNDASIEPQAVYSAP